MNLISLNQNKLIEIKFEVLKISIHQPNLINNCIYNALMIVLMI